MQDTELSLSVPREGQEGIPWEKQGH